MTKKEFITNLIRSLGYEVRHYNGSHGGRIIIANDGKEDFGELEVWDDTLQRVAGNMCRVRFKHCRIFNAYTEKEERDLVNKVNVWLYQRGFRAVAGMVHYSKSLAKSKYLVIDSEIFPWDQCAKAPTNEEILEQAGLKEAPDESTLYKYDIRDQKLHVSKASPSYPTVLCY